MGLRYRAGVRCLWQVYCNRGEVVPEPRCLMDFKLSSTGSFSRFLMVTKVLALLSESPMTLKVVPRN